MDAFHCIKSDIDLVSEQAVFISVNEGPATDVKIGLRPLTGPWHGFKFTSACKDGLFTG